MFIYQEMQDNIYGGLICFSFHEVDGKPTWYVSYRSDNFWGISKHLTINGLFEIATNGPSVCAPCASFSTFDEAVKGAYKALEKEM